MRVLRFIDELPGVLTKYDQVALKRRVLERDHYVCQLCWAKNGEGLSVHHYHDDPTDSIYPVNVGSIRDPYVETKIYDLVTLHVSCHGKVEQCNPRSPLVSALTNVMRLIYAEYVTGFKLRKNPVLEVA